MPPVARETCLFLHFLGVVLMFLNVAQKDGALACSFSCLYANTALPAEVKPEDGLESKSSAYASHSLSFKPKSRYYASDQSSQKYVSSKCLGNTPFSLVAGGCQGVSHRFISNPLVNAINL